MCRQLIKSSEVYQQPVVTCLHGLCVCESVSAASVCVSVITDCTSNTVFLCFRKSLFLSFANQTDILEKFYLLKVSCHLVGRQAAAELNYNLPYRQETRETQRRHLNNMREKTDRVFASFLSPPVIIPAASIKYTESCYHKPNYFYQHTLSKEVEENYLGGCVG